MKTMLCAGVAAAALLVGSAAPSHAMLILKISDSNPADTQQVFDLTNSGTVSFDSSIGGYSINFVVGSSTPAVGTPAQAVLDLDSMDITSRNGGGILNFALTDTGYLSSASPITSFFNAVGGTLSGTGSSYSVTTYMDCGDAAFGTGTQLTSQSFVGPSFSGNASANVASCGHPFSLTQLVSLQLPGGGAQFSGDSSLAVPEPSTIALFGAGLLGLGFALRRKGRSTAVAA